MTPAPSRFTGRMREVLILVGRDNLSYKAIALRLDISVHTVRTYAWRVRDTLDPSSDAPRHLMTQYYWRNQTELDGPGAPM